MTLILAILPLCFLLLSLGFFWYFFFFIRVSVLTTTFKDNNMLEFPICWILMWSKASVSARVIHDNLTDGLYYLRHE